MNKFLMPIAMVFRNMAEITQTHYETLKPALDSISYRKEDQ